MRFDPSSRARLSPRDLDRFPGTTLFDRLGRAICRADCLPRKELFESWEVSRRARRRFRGGRVVDLACGHGLVAHLMLLLDDTSKTALAADRTLPPSARAIAQAMSLEWPRLSGRVELLESPLDRVVLQPEDVVVSTHACGALTDDVLARAIAARARVVVLPCCHDEHTGDAGGLRGWLDVALSIDTTRAARLRASGYAVHTQIIPDAITAKNRILMGEPG